MHTLNTVFQLYVLTLGNPEVGMRVRLAFNRFLEFRTKKVKTEWNPCRITLAGSDFIRPDKTIYLEIAIYQVEINTKYSGLKSFEAQKISSS